MFCEKYSCKLSETACFVRRKNALSTSMRDIYKPGYADTGCANCDQGAAVMEKVNPKEAAKYSKSLNKIRHDALWEKAREKKPKKKPAKTKHVFKPVPKKQPSPKKNVEKKIRDLEIIELLIKERDFHLERADCCSKAIIVFGGAQ